MNRDAVVGAQGVRYHTPLLRWGVQYHAVVLNHLFLRIASVRPKYSLDGAFHNNGADDELARLADTNSHGSLV